MPSSYAGPTSSYSSYYPSYYSTPFFSSGYSGGYSSYYSRGSSYSSGSTAPSSYSAGNDCSRLAREAVRDLQASRTRYRGSKTDTELTLGLRSKSVEPSLAKEASVTRELYREREFTPAREEVRRPSVREESVPAAPTTRRSNSSRYGSSSSLAPVASALPDWVSSASSRFSKATASLYQKSRGALGVLRSSSLFDLRGSSSDLRGSTSDLRASNSNLTRGSVSDLRGSTSNLHRAGSISSLHSSKLDPSSNLTSRGSVADLRSSTSELRSSTADLRGSTSCLAHARDRARRQTTQVSELDLSRARMWGEPRDESRESSVVCRGRRGTLDLGYSSIASSRRQSIGEEPDYKKLWEESQAENARLRVEMAGIRVELEDTRRKLREAMLERAGGRAAMEERLEKMQQEVASLGALREENEELREQNSSLSLVISKMAEKAGKTTRV